MYFSLLMGWLDFEFYPPASTITNYGQFFSIFPIYLILKQIPAITPFHPQILQNIFLNVNSFGFKRTILSYLK